MKRLKTLIKPDSRSPKKVKYKCGIYEIVHLPTARRYTGSSMEVERRINWHVIMLRKGKHHCRFLQNCWNKYEESQFVFFLLEECDVADLVRLEQARMDSVPSHLSMNGSPSAGCCRGWKHYDETKVKMSAAAKRVGSDPEERKRRSERAKAQHAKRNFGAHCRTYKITEITCKTCLTNFTPDKLASGIYGKSNYCDKCRPIHKGGNYKLAVKERR